MCPPRCTRDKLTPSKDSNLTSSHPSFHLEPQHCVFVFVLCILIFFYFNPDFKSLILAEFVDLFY